MDDRTLALLGDRAAQERITERGELLTCPVCGKQPELRNNGPQIDRGNRFLEDDCDFFTAWHVTCRCGESKNGWVTQYHLNDDGTVTMIGKRDGRREAILNWNRRAPLLTPEQIKRLEIEKDDKHKSDQV